jgi:(2S)-methylsuccinyl-CoA dehydrogenase
MTASLGPVIPQLCETCRQARDAAQDLLVHARTRVRERVEENGKVSGALLEREQNAAHGLAWMATAVAALDTMLAWAEDLAQNGAFGVQESLILQAAYAEYCRQLTSGLTMSQGEIATPDDLGIADQAAAFGMLPAVALLRRAGFTPAVKEQIARHLAEGHFGALGEQDETLTLIREQFRKFVDDQVVPYAHDWHLKDALIPLPVVEQMAELGVFGLTIPEDFGGLGLGKMAMCIVTEELSRGYIGVGSLGTRSEIAGELIRLGGTEAQKSHYLPKIASGEILPTAVFTEPNTGSDLASLRTRASRDGELYRVTGNKTWITHAARSDLMTLLTRTNPQEGGYKGLSMLLAEKPRGSDSDPFPAAGMDGGEIKVLGYRGMKEYELSFDGFEVPAENLLGGEEGKGFKQLMETFESARIQTAARAVGVAQNALELGLTYAQERVQFGKALFEFPRVHQKLAWMAVETMVARQLTYFAGRRKDADVRCDIEAGMAKLLAARVAWSNADNALQIHGGNGYAEEYKISRVLCDARILNIFEGAAEIQAQVIAKGLLSR